MRAVTDVSMLLIITAPVIRETICSAVRRSCSRHNCTNADLSCRLNRYALALRLSTVWKNTGSDISDDEPLTAVCSLVFTNTCDKRAPFRMYRLAWTRSTSKCTIRWNTGLVGYSAVQLNFRHSDCSAHEALDNSTQRRIVWYHIQHIQHLQPADRLQNCQSIDANLQIITDRSVVALCRIGHHGYRSSAHPINLCVCTQGEQEWWTTSANSHRCKTHK